jgi:hypothetical protein
MPPYEASYTALCGGFYGRAGPIDGRSDFAEWPAMQLSDEVAHERH